MLYENNDERDLSAGERVENGIYLNDLAAGTVVELDTSPTLTTGLRFWRLFAGSHG